MVAVILCRWLVATSLVQDFILYSHDIFDEIGHIMQKMYGHMKFHEIHDFLWISTHSLSFVKVSGVEYTSIQTLLLALWDFRLHVFLGDWQLASYDKFVVVLELESIY